MEIKITDRMPLETAMKKLKSKLIKEGIFKELKQRRYYMKPSEKKKRKAEEAARRNARSRKYRQKRR